ncbi:Carotenoid isomerooxygenase [Armadillidium vulgare]|nr:Carotenoid isomerooxygenase [Armadillidium vulgare]
MNRDGYEIAPHENKLETYKENNICLLTIPSQQTLIDFPLIKKFDGRNSPVEEEDGRINYYPNCDARVWLRSCTHPVEEPISGIQTGVIPTWLNGSLIRNGPGRIQVGNDTYNHLFDGSALLHRFHFKDGEVKYSNKFLKSSSYLRDTEAQRIVVNYFGTRAHPDPCKTILQNIASRFSFEEHFTDNAQISVYPYGDGLYALTETPYIFRIDPDSLETREKIDMTKYLTIFSHTAHPHVDDDGCVYNIGQGVGLFGPVYHICKFPANSPFNEAKILGSVKARWKFNPCYMHSFALTQNYFVIIEQPLVVSTKKVIKGIVCQESLIHALEWWNKETQFHVIERSSGNVHKLRFETEAFFFLHVINAFVEQDCIVIDICAYKDAKMLHCMFTEALKDASYDPSYAKMFRGRPKRWVLPLNPGVMPKKGGNILLPLNSGCVAKWSRDGKVFVEPEILATIGCEVPRINYENYNGKKYRYFYAICSDVDHPKPGTGEDDGIVVSSLLRCKGLDRQICLLILDATSFKEMGRVEFECLGPVPKCLHGWYVPEDR